jgi:hypothetical protein
MYALTDTQRREIQQYRCFFQNSNIPGWIEFYSADPRFRLSMTIPESMYESYQFYTHEPNFQELILPGIIIVRTDLTKSRATQERLLSEPLHTMDRTNAQPIRKRRHRYEIGGLRGTPECISYGNGAVRVWFESADHELWSFERSASFDDDEFLEILRKVRFLAPQFFAELPL